MIKLKNLKYHLWEQYLSQFKHFKKSSAFASVFSQQPHFLITPNQEEVGYNSMIIFVLAFPSLFTFISQYVASKIMQK